MTQFSEKVVHDYLFKTGLNALVAEADRHFQHSGFWHSQTALNKESSSVVRRRGEAER